MTETTTVGLPHVIAFIVTICAMLGCIIYASAMASKEGKLRASQIWKVVGIFFSPVFNLGNGWLYKWKCVY